MEGFSLFLHPEISVLSSIKATLLSAAFGTALLTCPWFDRPAIGQSASQPTSPPSNSRPTAYWPEGVEVDKTIPTPREFFGFAVGHRHLSHAQVAGYLRAVAAVSDRVTVHQYGQTHGKRPLLLATITSPENRQRLDSIRQAHRQLAKRAADQIDLANLPAVINMGYGVHGDEPSATNCSPLVVHYLAAAQGQEIEQWLNRCVILLDPSLNPDGFNRFANWANRYRGRVLNPDPQHAEHNQQWPPGRVNYYWFDLNRDWLPLVHPESRARMRWYHQWKPNVVLDFHEMGTNSTFFFQPGIPQRTNPLTPARNVELTNRFGDFHARALDQRGSLYYTQEVFDDFYMGKGSTYPDLHGSVGILFEQASSRGHLQRNQDGLLRFHDTIANQFTASLSSLRATTALRMDLLEHKRDFYQDGLEMGRQADQAAYVFSSPNNWNRLKAFADVLLQHDIECYWVTQPVDHEGLRLKPYQDLVVPLEQPEYRFLRSLLMRRTQFRENIFYDVSSWTLPLAFGVRQRSLNLQVDPNQLVRAKIADRSPTNFKNDEKTVAYLVDWRDDGAMKLLAKLLRADIKVRVAMKPFSAANGQRFDRGTLSIPLGIQPAKRKRIESLLANAAEQGVRVTPVATGLTPTGIDLGSNNFPVVRKPSLAMITGAGVSAYGAGVVWHQLDTRVGLPLTMIKSSRFESARLRDYTTIILPSGRYSDQAIQKIKQWTEDGGTVVALGSSAAALAEQLTGKSIRINFDDRVEVEKEETLQEPFDSASRERALQLISGAIFKTRADLTHPLLFGVEQKYLPVFRTHANMVQPSENPYANPMVYDGENPLMAGYCSEENVDKIRNTASVSVYRSGRGRVIMMADSPNFRGFWRSTSRVFVNAIFFGDRSGP